MTSTKPSENGTIEDTLDRARVRMSSTGRNDPCPCGSNKKYKKCHLEEDQATQQAPTKAADPDEILMSGWRLFEQHRPGAAEKTFRSALVLRPDWADAYAGIGLSCLQVGDTEGARKAFGEVERISGALANELRTQNAKDAFTRKETQAYVRSCHALGCMAFDDKNYDETRAKLELVYSIDEGPVGTEARLITGIALLKQNRAADAVAILEPATKSESGLGRASMSLALAEFLAGNSVGAEAALLAALKTNLHFAKAVLGRGPRRQANFSAATPGSLEEALGYAQTYGDAWEAPAKAFLEEYLQKQAKLKKTATADQSTE